MKSAFPTPRALPRVHREFPHEQVAAHVRELLSLIGENPNREGLLETPERVARAWESLLEGYAQDERRALRTVFTLEEAAPGSDLVVVQDIEFESLCEHHLLPMRGKCHIAYIPGRRIIGLSKIPRLIELYAKRLQVQERLTAQIANALMMHLKPRGVLVITQAVHFCMIMRGVEKQLSHTTCATVRGIFEKRRDLELKVQGYLQLPFTPHGRK